MGGRTRPNTVDTGGELDDDAPDVDTEQDEHEDDEQDDTGADDASDEDEGDEEEDAEELDDAAFLASLSPAQRKAFDARLSAANRNGKTWRLRATGKDPEWAKRRGASPAGMPQRKPAPAGQGRSVPVDRDAIKAELLAEFRAEQTAADVRRAARAQLEQTMALPDDPAQRRAALDRAVKLLDLDGLDPDDVGQEIADLRVTMPSLFAPPRRGKARKSGVVGPAGSAPTRRRTGQAPAGVAELFD